MVTTVIASEQVQLSRLRLLRRLRGVFGFPGVLAILLAGLIFLLLPKSNADPDIGWHLRNAQFLMQHHAFLRQDLYSFTTRNKVWMDPEWMAELPFYFGWKWFGARGIFLVTYLSIASIVLGIFWLATLESRNVKGAFVASLLAVAFATVSFGPRTLLFGWIFLIAELGILYSFRSRSNLIWWLPPLFLAWVNTHGSWLIGLVLFAIFALCGCVEGQWGEIIAERWHAGEARKLIGAGFLSALALFVNPYGWRLPAYPFDLAFRQKLNIASIEEWRTLDFHLWRGKIALAVLAAAIMMQLVRRRRWRLHEIAFLLLGLYAGFTYSRFIFLAGILIVPMLAMDLRDVVPRYRPERDKAWLNAAIVLGCIVAICCKIPANHALRQAEAKQYPTQAQTYLNNFNPQGNVLTDYLWGGYMIWNVRKIPVFVDSRVDIYEHYGVFKDYLDLTQLRNSFGILDKYSIRYVLFRKSMPLAYLLAHNPGWNVDYQDSVTILFERKRSVK